MKINMKRTNTIILGVVYALLLVAYICTCFWAGFAEAGNSGFLLPDTGLTIPVIIVLAGTVAQGLVYRFARNNRTAIWFILGLIIFKTILVEIAIWLLCWYALDPAWISSSKLDFPAFHAHGWYTVFVSAFMLLTVAAVVFETIGCVKLIKNKK